MKKLLIIAWLVISFIILSRTEYYTRQGVVVDVDNGLVTVEDMGGHLWDAYADGLNIGDNVDLKMHTNYTDKYSCDDIIKDVVKK